ncbi:MAG: DNA/RNA non-specific endonuclease [Bacteroidales bacterium]|nr:DNA/RNA non-specific endonuclease [Bacteroidales bacterium]
MNKAVNHFLLVVSLLAVLSCGKTEDPFLYISFPSVTVDAAGKTVDLSVSSNQSWTASSDVSWLTVSPASGTGNMDIAVSVAENTEEARTGKVTFLWGGNPTSLTVQQVSGKSDNPPVPSDGSISIAQLRKFYEEGQKDDKYNTTANYFIKGSVISDYRNKDLGGVNNYTSLRAMVISDGTAGIMLYCDGNNTEFKLGDEVKVLVVKGQELSRYNKGPVQLNGIKLANVSKVGEKPLEAIEITAADLLTNKYESMYVAVKDVQVQASEVGKTFVMNDAHTSIIMEGMNGEVFDIFTSKYASFGNVKVPTGSGTLKGIGSVYGERMQICIAKTSDYAGLTGERFTGAASFSLFYSEYTHNGDKGSYTIQVLGDVEWTASCDSDGFSLSKTSGKGADDVILSFGDNPSTKDSRVAKVTFKTTDTSVAKQELVFTLTQLPFQELVSDKVPVRLEIPAVPEQDSVVFITHEFEQDGKQVYNYSMYYDARYKVSQWVAYPLYEKMLSGTKRTDAWAYDPKVPERDQARIFKAFSGYSRGHQLPSADRLINDAANSQTFYATNITPQNESMNSGMWADLEQKLRSVAKGCDTVYVVTGCVVKTQEDPVVTYIEDNIGAKVAVPKAYYKVCLKYKAGGSVNGGYSAVGFWMEHEPLTGTLSAYAKPVEDIEKLTGYDFFHNLDDNIEKAVEKNWSAADWNL